MKVVSDFACCLGSQASPASHRSCTSAVQVVHLGTRKATAGRGEDAGESPAHKPDASMTPQRLGHLGLLEDIDSKSLQGEPALPNRVLVSKFGLGYGAHGLVAKVGGN